MQVNFVRYMGYSESNNYRLMVPISMIINSNYDAVFSINNLRRT